MTSKRLIINADDLGLSYGITDGILFAHREGILTSASLMVNQPATDYAVSHLFSVNELRCGIHLNLCQGTPVLAPNLVPSLVTPSGEFQPPSEMSKRLALWRVSPQEVENEFRAQIQRMKSYGFTPTHADSHHRLHTYPAAVGPFRRAIHKEGVFSARSPRKRYWPADGTIGSPHAGPLHRRIATKAYLEFLHSVTFRDVKLPDAGVTLHPRYGGRLELLKDAWCMTLEHLPAGTYEMWCHPGFQDRQFSPTDRLASQRDLEIGILTDPSLREILTRRQIELITFDQI
jgi:predicted glycoside hydrolase/deacetylase ChbG (UPF0249 family)